MIRLGTVFSGIGAIEHALKRMGIKHKIIFACDNGDIEILSKKIGMNLDEIKSELILLSDTIHRINSNDEYQDVYKAQLTNMLGEASKELTELIEILNVIPTYSDSLTATLLEKIIVMPDLAKRRKLEYEKFKINMSSGSAIQQKFYEFEVILEISNDFKKDNGLVINADSVDNLKSKDGILWKDVLCDLQILYTRLEKVNGKRIIRRVQDLSQRVSQLHEKINYIHVQNDLIELGENWKAKKIYVDNLYAGQENRNKVKQSYLANYDIDKNNFHWNVAFLDGHQYAGKIDLFVGGSPCQSFSLVGKQRGLEDTRGTLFYEYARLIKEIEPKVFIYENVKAVLSNDNGITWSKMQQVFNELGYRFYYKLLNSSDYGIPQNRERIFVVGFRNDITLDVPFEFPKSIPLKKKMKDFLVNNAPGGYFLPKKGVAFVTKDKNISKKYTQIDGDIQLCQKKNQQFNWHGDFVFQSENDAKAQHIDDLEKYYLSEKVQKYVLASGTKGFYSKPATDLEVARPLLTTMHKMHRAGVDNYVTTDGRLRKLTPRECLRLMGFSDNFKIVVSDTAMYQQAGNSIVVDVLIHLLESIFKSYPKLLTGQ